ncbi:hypothetical protein OG497_39530 [Streptomyces sp. NBC_01242]|uniref:hypothetical protein n=1 Tax=Streptomyces sp. NBC_01242 TaxID=2903795 RepID=UPI00225C28DD|nr:hypothetical protein [Streptomyces sp. NBC_01242]MCX4799936.1 hypothetical protein [Streptomyces sp. NBC_01242]
MTTATNHDGTGTQQSTFSKIVQAVGALTTMLAAGGALALAVTGHTEAIPAVAVLGAAGVVGGATPVTINIIRSRRS